MSFAFKRILPQAIGIQKIEKQKIQGEKPNSCLDMCFFIVFDYSSMELLGQQENSKHRKHKEPVDPICESADGVFFIKS
jgi:hypothetical protein